jgi:type I restriction enzyme S subunit
MFRRDVIITDNFIFCNYAWERRKLGECFAERLDRSPHGELISVTIGGGIRRFSDLDRHDNSSEDKSNYKTVKTGDIAYNSMRMWQGASGYSPYTGILSPAYTVIIPQEGIDSLFFSYSFKIPWMILKFRIHSQGITSDTWNLKYPSFSKIECKLPLIQEQKQVAVAFERFDHLITLHQRKPFLQRRRRKLCSKKYLVLKCSATTMQNGLMFTKMVLSGK